MAQPLSLDPPLPYHIVHQFPLPTWIENLAIRSNGSILLTLITTPELILVDPSKPEPKLIHKFDEIAALTGVIELEHDVFYIAGGNFDLQKFSNEFASYIIWEVDMRSFESEGKATISKICELKNSGLPNGFETLPGHKNVFLFADSEVGAVFKVDVKAKTNEILIQADEMKPPPAGMPLGINGIKIRDGCLYWSNTGKQLYCRIKIDGEGKPVGEAEVLKKDIIIDDFVFDKVGNAWMTHHAVNTLGVVKPDGEWVIALGHLNQLTVAGGTACQFGRTEKDGHILYFTTTGSLAAPVDGDKVEGGKVVAIDTSKFQ